MREHFHGTQVSSRGCTPEAAEKALGSGAADLIAFERAFTANHDPVEKRRTNGRLALQDPKTFYSRGAKGCIDAVALKSWRTCALPSPVSKSSRPVPRLYLRTGAERMPTCLPCGRAVDTSAANRRNRFHDIH